MKDEDTEVTSERSIAFLSLNSSLLSSPLLSMKSQGEIVKGQEGKVNWGKAASGSKCHPFSRLPGSFLSLILRDEEMDRRGKGQE